MNELTEWLRDQWSNPNDIFTILLIVGGDIVQAAIAQLCAGPIPYFTPVCFSFGWVTYAISAMHSALGENRLMPRPEVDSMLINVASGYKRKNCSWILSRILRDFEMWRPSICDELERNTLTQLRAEHRLRSGTELLDAEDIRIGLRVTVWQCNSATGVGTGDMVYWSGPVISVLQLAVSLIPWFLWAEAFTFFVVAVGTLLAFASGALPQWHDEKIGVRKARSQKPVLLTEGNGAKEVLLILGCEGGIDLECLAAPQRILPGPRTTRILSITLATLWTALLISVSGWSKHSWFLVSCGLLGMVHNVAAAGVKRQPKASGIDLEYQDTLIAEKVMKVLWMLERMYPRAGTALLPEFFPGPLRSRETRLWEYAYRRISAYDRECRNYKKASVHDKSPHLPQLWLMPPLLRPKGQSDDGDIPVTGRYQGIQPDTRAPDRTMRIGT